MEECELRKLTIEKFVAIQRIKEYGVKELEYQEQLALVELEELGISPEELSIMPSPQ